MNIPETELELELEEKVRQLKIDLNAVILAHFYQESEIQDLADFVGDQPGTSKKS